MTNKEFPIGFAYEELNEEEMMDVDGGLWTATFTTLGTTSLVCIGASVVISAGATIVLTVTVCK